MTTATMERKNNVLQIRIDRELREEADRLFVNMGLDTQTAVRFFLKQAVLQNGLPFTVVSEPVNPIYTEPARSKISKAIRQLEEGKGVEHDIIEA